MDKCVCRTITFVNNHVPSSLAEGAPKPPYITLGFFDGMLTERIDLNYKSSDLKPLWKYSIKVSGESKGAYSFQNTFCFSRDEWNDGNTDDRFWSHETDRRYPLCFIVFFQIRQYATGKNGVQAQCRMFNELLAECRKNSELEGEYYTYSTIDKNDVVVCIKSDHYKKTVDAIKRLHAGNNQIVYSYTVMSINRKVLAEIDQIGTEELLNEEISSICFKGIANSYRYKEQYIGLDTKYKDFCEQLIEEIGNPQDHKLYDILGESDFRLIARNVNLKSLLKMVADGGLLDPQNKKYKFSIYISELLLNTETVAEEIDPLLSIEEWNRAMTGEAEAYKCKELGMRMQRMNEILARYSNPEIDEKALSFSSAIRQLMYSLRALEAAPTKKYDFYSIYEPLDALVTILEDKLQKETDVGESMMIYEFIHKISMTFHGTLRTDIQFFQIKDFNVVIHYAPAKLRAFYSLWTTKTARFFEQIGEQKQDSHKFVVAPGMFGRTSVTELFAESEKSQALMLITIPERNLYILKWMTIVLTHEVSHFVGGNIRRRREREGYIFQILSRVLELEMKQFICVETARCMPEAKEFLENNTMISEHLNDHYALYRDKICKENHITGQYQYHSRMLDEVIDLVYRSYEQIAEEKDIRAYVSLLKSECISRLSKTNGYRDDEKTITRWCNELKDDISRFFWRFNYECMHVVLDQLKVDMAETFADSIAILTLALSPTDYISSFLRSDMCAEEYRDNAERKNNVAHTILVRIYVVIRSVSGMAERMPESEFQKAWKGKNIFRTLVKQYMKNSAERQLCEDLYNFNKCICRLDGSKTEYHSMYNTEKRCFNNYCVNYYKDVDVIELFTSYIMECMESYWKNMENHPEAKALQENLREVYKKLSGTDPMNVIQGVEDFLSEYEKQT